MKSKNVIPEFVTKGVDICIDKIVMESLNEEDVTIYRAFVFVKCNQPVLVGQLANPDNRPWYCLWRLSENKRGYDFRTEYQVAEAVSAFIKSVKYHYRLLDFKYEVKLRDIKETRVIASATNDEAKRLTNTIEILLG